MERAILRMLHKKCRNNIYPSSNISRFKVPDDLVLWNVSFVNYNPVTWNSPALENKPWADLSIDDPLFKPKWNMLDDEGKVNRISFHGPYQIDDQGFPLNPFGRTGLRGRGILGRWGPNHAADPIVTRWKRDENGIILLEKNSQKRILQFVAIQRKDSGEWAIPGGMVDPGEKVSVTLQREFMEEAMNSLEKSKNELKIIEDKLKKFFSNGKEIYKGYVDDPRNTDNSWMETVAHNFHDENNDFIGNLDLQAGDDAKNVRWVDVNSKLILYASHKNLIEKTTENLNAFW